MLGTTVESFPAFLLLGAIIGVISHFIIRRFKQFRGFSFIVYSFFLSVLMYTTSFWYELNHGDPVVLEPIIVAYGPKTENQKDLMVEISKAHEYGYTPSDIRKQFPTIKKYIDALDVQKYLVLQALWFCLTFSLVILVLGRRRIARQIKAVPHIFRHHFVVVLLAILSLQFMFPPVYKQSGEIRSSMGYQFLLLKEDFVFIDLNLLIVQSVLVAMLLMLLRMLSQKKS